MQIGKRKEVLEMNFNNKKTKRIMAVIIILVVVAMVATAVIPAMIM